MPQACLLCERHTALTFHHLIPKTLHRRYRAKKIYSRAQLSLGIRICRLCHDGLHDLYDEKTLARCYSTVDEIISDADVLKHVEWVSRQRVR
jgi:hypothetical protein